MRYVAHFMPGDRRHHQRTMTLKAHERIKTDSALWIGTEVRTRTHCIITKGQQYAERFLRG
ncbi:hypothetical protein HAALTHF_13380n [Vreelandella aquamarina]|nr:hypothetical protein HAALTHF_13380n [Halomonas axialensis]